MLVREDGVWRYYGCPNSYWSEKCSLCREKLAGAGRPVRECVDCWKVEVWENGLFANRCRGKIRDRIPEGTGILEVIADAVYLLGHEPVIKITLGPVQVVRTGVPLEVYPAAPIDRVMIFYASTILERDQIRRYLLEAERLLSQYDDAVKFHAGEQRLESDLVSDESLSVIPVRRGCWKYDSCLGRWQDWYDVDRDWSEVRDENADLVKRSAKESPGSGPFTT